MTWLAAYETSSLRIVFVGGSQFGVELAKRALRAFGPVVYNLYGSTEVSYATIATPDDLRDEPGTVGGVVRGSIVKILDDDGQEVPAGVTGRIFVGNAGQFEGYTGGGGKEQIRGLMSSGDVGHFDDNGRLYIDGRDDDMIVSGGENVFPGEIEELLAGHEAIEEVAAVGVRRRAVRPAAEGLRRRARRQAADRGRGQGLRQRQPRQLQEPARGRVRRRACRATRPARCSSASSPACRRADSCPSTDRPSSRSRPRSSCAGWRASCPRCRSRWPTWRARPSVAPSRPRPRTCSAAPGPRTRCAPTRRRFAAGGSCRGCSVTSPAATSRRPCSVPGCRRPSRSPRSARRRSSIPTASSRSPGPRPRSDCR